MNCKPKDLAFVVRDSFGHGCDVIGTPVEVVESFKTELAHRDAWTLKKWFKCRSCGETFIAMYDADLQPIRGDRSATPSATDIKITDEALA